MNKMKVIKSSFFLLFAGMATLLTSCGGGDSGPKHSPEFNMVSSVKNPTAIVSYDLMGMMEKSKVMHSEELPFEIKMMMNVYFDKMFSSKSMGLKLEGNNHVVIAADEQGEFDYGFIMLNVLEQSKIKKGIKEFIKGKTEEEEGINYLTDKYSGAVAAWDSLNFVFAFSEEENIDLKGKTKSILGSRYIDGPDNKELEAFLNREDDMNAFVYLDRWAKMADAADENFKMDEDLMKLYDKGYMVASGNFDEGKIVFEMNVYADALKNSKYNVLSKGPISDEYLSYLSDDDLVMFGTANLDIDALFDILFQDEKMKIEFEDKMKESGLDELAIREIFTGEIAASLIDVEMKANPYYEEAMETLDDDFFADMEFNYVPKELPHPKFITTIGIKNSKKLETVINLIPGIVNTGSYYSVEDGFIVIKNNKLFVTSNKDLAERLANGEKLKPYSIEGGIKDPLYGYFNSDLSSLPDGFKNMIKDNGGDSGEESLKFFNEVENINFSGSFDHIKFEVILKDKTTNSLELIVSKMMGQVIEGADMFM